jgi:hypothetical protein
MNVRDSNQSSGDGNYISKRVMINGQFVTLYSSNGQTWVSSPEEIPALMERLESARITLNPGEKPQEGEAPPAAKVADAKVEEAPAPKVLQTKYRMKGPKPRPILRQGGKVIEGTPIDPISASGTTVSFSSDDGEGVRISPVVSPAKQLQRASSPNPRKKLIAPISPKTLKAKAAAEAKIAIAKVAAAKTSTVKTVKGKASVQTKASALELKKLSASKGEEKVTAKAPKLPVQSKARVQKAAVVKVTAKAAPKKVVSQQPVLPKNKTKPGAKSTKKAAASRKAQAKAGGTKKSGKQPVKGKASRR